ncbi:PQQ-dependent sugar dehydrogenase [bacterium]|nr:PQQ-dependent sugar dehydrogenase [bacterium]
MHRRFLMAFVLMLGITAAARAQFPIENAFPQLGFNRPVDLQHAGDGSDRLFVVEQAGRIFVFPNDPESAEADVFLDIRARVNDGGNEEGLLGLAFHPSYAENGYFYVNYSASNPRRNVIARYSVSADNPNVADPESETVLLSFEQPFSNHNGGQLAFGPDGYLYIATGDGGSGGDPQNNGQNRSVLLGKILRIDVDNSGAGMQYAIPEDNPFAGNSEGWAEEIYAYGLRNPWRFSFDPETGRLWAGDVGQNKYEEVDIIEKGKNYGWRIMEGFACFNPSSGCDQTGLELPIVEYGRSEGASITGGYVYRGENVPELKGQYVYADFVSGRIWGLTYNGPDDVENELLLASSENISSFGVDENGELYICSFGGGIFRFTPTVTSTNAAPNGIPEDVFLSSSYPSPALRGAADAVTVRVGLPAQQEMQLALYDTLGRQLRVVAEGRFDAGTHRFRIATADLSPGVYIYALRSEGVQLSKKLLVME